MWNTGPLNGPTTQNTPECATKLRYDSQLCSVACTCLDKNLIVLQLWCKPIERFRYTYFLISYHNDHTFLHMDAVSTASCGLYSTPNQHKISNVSLGSPCWIYTLLSKDTQSALHRSHYSVKQRSHWGRLTK